ncbi:MAG: hypothetical protein KJ571_01925 [Bacteroidetes bacterium]|nr:hypothetical protein [Bacteroidota bacterium]
MKKNITIIILLFFFISGKFFAQEKSYIKIVTPDYWKSLTILGEQVKKDGSKKHEFGDWQIFFPRMYINFVKKFQKDGGTFEYYAKVDAGGAFDLQIRFKDGPGKSSEAYNDDSGEEIKLLIKEVNEVIAKVSASIKS